MANEKSSLFAWTTSHDSTNNKKEEIHLKPNSVSLIVFINLEKVYVTN